VQIAALIVQVSVVIFTAGSLAGVGLALAPRDMIVPLLNRRFIALALIVNWVVAPALALLLIEVVPLAPPYATGLLLLALVPCAPFAPAMVRIAHGSAAYTAALLAVSALGTVLVLPIAVPLLIDGLSVEPAAIIRPLVLLLLLPVLLGSALRAIRPDTAERLRLPVARMTNIAGAVLFAILVVAEGRSMLDAIGSYAIAAQLAFLVLLGITAHAAGAGLAEEQRSVLTIGSCTRNLGAALAPLAAIAADRRTIVMIVISAPATLVVSAAAARWIAGRTRAAAVVS
jgi:BASS family bile acid:Na+ symporter